jgi:uncharacterized protein YkuJ
MINKITPKIMDELITQEQLASHFNVTIQSISNHLKARNAPKYVERIKGSKIMVKAYKKPEAIAFIESRLKPVETRNAPIKRQKNFEFSGEKLAIILFLQPKIRYRFEQIEGGK